MSSFTEKSQREIKRMEDVIYTLLKLAQLDAGMIQMEKAPENLSVLIKQLRFPVKKMLFYPATLYGYQKPSAIL